MTATTCPSHHLFTARCVPCTVTWMSMRTLDQVENAHDLGLIDTDARDGYRHIWAISATRSATYDHWMSYPASPLARTYADLLSRAIPGGRAYC